MTFSQMFPQSHRQIQMQLLFLRLSVNSIAVSKPNFIPV